MAGSPARHGCPPARELKGIHRLERWMDLWRECRPGSADPGPAGPWRGGPGNSGRVVDAAALIGGAGAAPDRDRSGGKVGEALAAGAGDGQAAEHGAEVVAE